MFDKPTNNYSQAYKKLLILLGKYYRIMPTLRKERLALSKGRKGGTHVTAHDTIINLVDKLLIEKEKNFSLQMQLNQLQSQQESKNKTDQK